ncbi:hypothetical protein [Rhodanobacter sp. FDAARGOS 1247]|nr:hypothetical protein [Rhodanobacter sp. FDAARGOS 1247]
MDWRRMFCMRRLFFDQQKSGAVKKATARAFFLGVRTRAAGTVTA